MSGVQVKYNEDKITEELWEYVESTYSQHYSGEDGVQAMDLIISSGHGVGFCIGALIKYASRYGKKGDSRKDIFKMLHYAMFLLHLHDKRAKQNASE